MEGFWGILKRERYYGKRFYSKKALVDMIENYIRYYNTRRVQRKLGVLTPILSRKPLCCIRAPCPVRSKKQGSRFDPRRDPRAENRGGNSGTESTCG